MSTAHAAPRLRVFGKTCPDLAHVVVCRAECGCGASPPLDVTVESTRRGGLECTACHAQVALPEDLVPWLDKTIPAAADRSRNGSGGQASRGGPSRRSPSQNVAIIAAVLLAIGASVVFVFRVGLQGVKGRSAGDATSPRAPAGKGAEAGTGDSAGAKGANASVDPAVPDPLSEITLAEIEHLLRRPDVAGALAQAQVWQNVITEGDVPADDPRSARLKEVIESLEQRLVQTATAGGSGVLSDFREMLKELRAAIDRSDLDRAHAARKRAESLIAAHRNELVPLMAGYSSALESLRLLEERQASIEGIDRLLTEAVAQAGRGDVVNAQESEARAKFLAYRTPLFPAQVSKLEGRLKDEIVPTLRIARGRHAIEQARQCQKNGDAATLQSLFREVHEHLDGLPKNRVEAAMRDLDTISKLPPPARKSGSKMAADLRLRTSFEELLRHFASADVPATVRAADRVLSEAGSGSESRMWSERVDDVVLGMLEGMTDDALALRRDSPRASRELIRLREATLQASRWKTHERLRRLETRITERGRSIAAGTIDLATQWAAQGRHQQAIERLAIVRSFGDASLMKRADLLQAAWTSELSARKRRARFEEVKSNVTRLAAENRRLDAWRAWVASAPELSELRDDPDYLAVDRAVREELGVLLQETLASLDGLLKRNALADVRKLVAELEDSNLPPQYASSLKKFTDHLESIARQADAKFAELEKQYGTIAKREMVLELCRELPRVLELSPDHKKAAALLERARERGRKYAEVALRESDRLKSDRAGYQEKLEEVIALDPEGPSGAKARQRLSELKKGK